MTEHHFLNFSSINATCLLVFTHRIQYFQCTSVFHTQNTIFPVYLGVSYTEYNISSVPRCFIHRIQYFQCTSVFSVVIEIENTLHKVLVEYGWVSGQEQVKQTELRQFLQVLVSESEEEAKKHSSLRFNIVLLEADNTRLNQSYNHMY